LRFLAEGRIVVGTVVRPPGQAARHKELTTMNKYLFVYHGPREMPDGAEATVADAVAGLPAWMAWAEKVGSALLDFGTPVSNGQYVMPGGEAKPTTSDITGYSLVQADTMDAALTLAHAHPHLLYPGGCEIEVLEAGASLPVAVAEVSLG
jgi:hypothetical protein